MEACDDSDGNSGQLVSTPGKQPRWTRVYFDYTNGRLCPQSPDGVGWLDLLIDPDGRVLVTRLHCGGVGVTEPPPPPDLPSPIEVFDSAPIPQPKVMINPVNAFEDADGIVGFEAWLWYEQETEVSVDAGIPGLTVTANVELVELTWDMGDGHTVGATTPGSFEKPAATYAYTRQCDCTITLTATWGGTYTVSGEGFEPVTIDLGTRDYVGTRPYPVAEVEAVVGG